MTEQRRHGSIRQLRRKPWPRRRWVPPVLMVVGLAGFIGVYLWRPPQPLPQAALPPAPKLLEGWQRPALLNPAVFPSSPRPTPPAEGVPEPEPVPPEMPERSQEPAPESDSQTTHMSEAQTPQEMPTPTVTPHETSSAAAITRVLRTLTEPDGSSPDATPIVPRKSPPRPALEAPPPATEPPQFQKERRPTAKLEGSLAEKVPTVSPKVVSTPPAPGKCRARPHSRQGCTGESCAVRGRSAQPDRDLPGRIRAQRPRRHDEAFCIGPQRARGGRAIGGAGAVRTELRWARPDPL